MADYYRDVIRILKNNGYEFKRQGCGDHEIWWNPPDPRDRRSKVEIEIHCKRHSEGSRASESFLADRDAHDVEIVDYH